jgi:Leucine-rich repeat (LRR) protein
LKIDAYYGAILNKRMEGMPMSVFDQEEQNQKTPGQLSEEESLKIVARALICSESNYWKFQTLSSYEIQGILPEEIGNLKQLRVLDLVDNQIHIIPAEIGQLENLEELTLSFQPLWNAPPEIGRLKNLIKLSFSNSEIKRLPAEIGQLENLRVLWLDHSGIATLPEEIGALHHLVELHLESSALESLPESLGQLQNLQKLGLTSSPLKHLPASIGQLSGISELKLSYTQLTTLPPELGQMENLRSLAADHTPLSQLPPGLFQSARLRSLDLSETELTTLPAELFSMSDLEELNLAHTKITVLPREIGQMVALKKLNLAHTKISQLPPDLFNLPCLEELNLRATSLTTLPPEISRLVKLKNLDLSYLSLPQLPPELFKLKMNFTSGGSGIVIDHLRLENQDPANLLRQKIQPFAYLPPAPLAENPERFLCRGWEKFRQIWAEGTLTREGNQCFISAKDRDRGSGQEVWPETVGQCSGYRDIAGTLIYEGDILAPLAGAVDDENGALSQEKLGLVSFRAGAFYLEQAEESVLLALWLERAAEPDTGQHLDGGQAYVKILSSLYTEEAPQLCPWLKLDSSVLIRE